MKLALVLIFLVFLCCGCDDKWKYAQANITQICIEGHVYYFNKGIYASSIAPKLTDEGRPVPCDCHTVAPTPDVPVH